ncbi:MAG: hypothetical protein IIY58_04145, partial [Aeriscardovia sp.]|nr:hypothetical protein [Aeriscardovia sp.]
MALLGKGSDHMEGPDIENDSGSFDDASSTTSGTASTSFAASAPAPASTSAPAAAPASAPADTLTWGTVYKTVGDVPDDDISFALPKADYRNACYMWQVPNYEVVVPGDPYYRMPINHAMLSAFGFLDTD